MLTVLKSTHQIIYYGLIAGVILTNVFIFGYLILNDEIITYGPYSIYISYGITIAMILIISKTVEIIGHKNHDYKVKALTVLILTSTGLAVAILGLTVMTDNYFDCRELLSTVEIYSNGNITICVNYLNENPGSTGAQVIEAIERENNSILDRELGQIDARR